MFKKLALCVLVAAVAFITTGLQAQEMTDDVAFLRLGYQWNTLKFDLPNAPDFKLNGVAIEGEYNLNLGGMLLGFALEYAYVSDTKDKAYDYGFLSPMVTLKFLAPGGFYIGPGLSARYLMGVYEPDTTSGEPESELDLWVNGVAGYMAPIAEGIYLDLQARFGWNLTKNQFAEGVDIDTNYNMAFYVGFGTRTRATGI